MNARSPLVRLLLALSLGALLLAGLTPGTSAESSDSLAATPASGQVEPVTDRVVEDDVLLVARRQVRIDAMRINWAGGQAVWVHVSPRLPGRQHYRVTMKVRHQGRWVICEPGARFRVNDRVARTFGVPGENSEYVRFRACKNKGARKYKVIVPAQHGFARTTARAHWPSAPLALRSQAGGIHGTAGPAGPPTITSASGVQPWQSTASRPTATWCHKAPPHRTAVHRTRRPIPILRRPSTKHRTPRDRPNGSPFSPRRCP